MPAHSKKTIQTAALISIPIIVAYSFRMIDMFRTDSMSPLAAFRSAIYISVLIAWAFSIYHRIIQKKTRRYLLEIACLMIFWIAIRTIKYNFDYIPGVEHWLWYFYYLPMIYIPFLSVFVARSICQGEDFRISWNFRILYIPAVILLLMVLTNDLHQLVFIFPEGAPKLPVSGYRYGVGYYAVVLWMALCFIGVVVSVFVRNRMRDKTRRILIPVAILGVLALYGILYILKVPFVRFWLGDFTIFFCLCFLSFYESLFKLNLIRSNARYSDLFRCSSVPAVIVDDNRVEEISTAAYSGIPGDVLKQAEGGPIIMEGGIRLSSAPIRNGHVLWQEDISPLLALNRELETTGTDIEEQNTAELEAYRAEYQRRRLVEKNRLYDKMQAQTEDKVERLSYLLDQLEKTDDCEEEKRLLLRISVIGAYIKRRNNLSFLSENWKRFPAIELKNCVEQSMECLNLFGIDGEQEFKLKNDMIIGKTIRLYEAFEEAVEYCLDTLSEIFLVFSESEKGITMSMRLCTGADFSGFSMNGMTVCDEGGGEWLLNYFIGNGGIVL